MYADNITDSMQKTIDETARRRSIQLQYNADHGITPKQIQKAITSALPTSKEEAGNGLGSGYGSGSGKASGAGSGINSASFRTIQGADGSKQRVYIEPDSTTMVADPIVRSMSKEELEKRIANTTALMKQHNIATKSSDCRRNWKKSHRSCTPWARSFCPFRARGANLRSSTEDS